MTLANMPLDNFIESLSNVWTMRERDSVFGMHIPPMKLFQMTQRSMALLPQDVSTLLLPWAWHSVSWLHVRYFKNVIIIEITVSCTKGQGYNFVGQTLFEQTSEWFFYTFKHFSAWNSYALDLKGQPGASCVCRLDRLSVGPGLHKVNLRLPTLHLHPLPLGG